MVKNNVNKSYQIEEIDKKVMDHIYDYRITTCDVLKNLFFQGQDISFVKEYYGKLRDAGYLASAPLHPCKHYYYLTEKAIMELYNHDKGASFGFVVEQPLIETYCILDFCCMGNSLRKKYTYESIKKDAPELLQEHISDDQYFIGTKNNKLIIGWVIVDHQLNVDRVFQRLFPIVLKRCQYEAWENLIMSGHFAIAIVTSWETKAQELRKKILENQQQREGCGIEFSQNTKSVFDKSNNLFFPFQTKDNKTAKVHIYIHVANDLKHLVLGQKSKRKKIFRHK